MHGPTDPWGKAVGDINGDGKIDLLVGGQTAGGLVWYENPSWVKHVISSALGFRTDLQVVDVDKDGLNDVVVLAADASQSPLIGWYKNPGASGSWKLNVIEADLPLHDAKVADLNGDGKIDIVARDQQVFSSGHGDSIHVYLQITPTTWTHVTFHCVNGEGLRVADVNGDGKPDIIIAGTWFENSGTGTVWTPHSYTSTYTYTSVTVDVADVNGDGRPDIILEPAEPVGTHYRASWFEAPVDARQAGWTEHIFDSNIETDHHFVGAADFNNDGLMDIATAEQTTGSYPHTVEVFLNSGAGLAFKKEIFDSAGSHNDRVADIFGDGNMDIFGANWLGNQVDLYVNHSKPRAPLAKPATQVTASAFHAEWSFVKGATDFRLDVATDTGFTSLVSGYSNLSVTDTGQTVSPLGNGATYYYRVRSETANGVSVNSNRVSVTTGGAGAPPAPVATAAGGITQIGFTATWTASSGATGYRVDVATDSLFGSGLVKNDTSVGNVLSMSIAGLSPGFTYYYRVRATNAGGTSSNSNKISVTTLPLAPPAPLATAATSITSGGFTSHWNTSTGATGYRLDVATDSLFVLGFVESDTSVGNVLAVIVSGFSPGVSYYYRVRAVNAGGTSPNSNRIAATTLPLAPPPPIAGSATGVTTGGFSANWSLTSGATGYRLDVATDSLFVSGFIKNDTAVGNVLIVPVAGLSPGVTYYYRIRATNSGGTSPNSNRISVTTLPTAPPAPLAASATGVTSGGFTSNWGASTGATGYRLDVATDSLFGSGFAKNDTSVGNVLAVPISGLSAGITYFYRIRATNSGGTSANSNRITVTTLPSAPPAPLAGSATSITSGGFTANWGTSAGATGYRLDVATDSLFGSGLVKNDTSVGNVLSISLAGLSSGVTYYYRVRATNAGGTSPNSNRVAVTTLLASPAAPLAVSATLITSGGFTANWNASIGAAGYSLDVATDSLFGSGFVKNDTSVGNVLTTPVSGLNPATAYYYRVRAANNGGTSPNSNRIAVATLPSAPLPPAAKPASQITASGFRANWSRSVGATAYRLDVSTDGAFGSFTGVYQNLSVPDTQLVVSSLIPGTTYFYRVRSENSGGASGNSSVIAVITIPPAPLATAGTSVTKTGFTAAWNASTGATGYRLDVATDSLFAAGFVESDSSAGNTLSAAVAGLSPGTMYYYRVRAFNLSGQSGNSNRIAVTTILNSPGAPVARSATGITGGGFTAHWDSVFTATAYRLDVATDSLFGAGFVKNDTSVGNVLAAPITGLNPGVTYFYRVRATNAGGTSPASNRISATTVPNPPGVPQAKFATLVTTSGFRANWGSVVGATGYRLDVSTSGGFTSFVGAFNDFAVVDTGQVVGLLTAGTVYFYRVRAENLGGEGNSSSVISVSTVPLPPVAMPATGVSTKEFTAVWSPAPGATGYRVDVASDSLFSTGIIWADSAVGNVLSAGVPGLAPATTYYYRVRATDNGGTSANSNREQVTTSTLLVNVRVFLQGATLNDSMQTSLKRGNFIPHLQPYSIAPWYYAGTDSAARIPDSTVDWVLVELRSDSAKQVARRAGFLKNTGIVTDTDGVSPLRFPGQVEGNYFVVIYHRNHLTIMSRTAVTLNSAGSLYDFSTGQGQAFGSLPMTLMGTRWCMYAGDANADGQVTTLDFSPWLANAKAALTGYSATDFNCDGQNTTSDFTLWLVNAKAAARSSVP